MWSLLERMRRSGHNHNTGTPDRAGATDRDTRAGPPAQTGPSAHPYSHALVRTRAGGTWTASLVSVVVLVLVLVFVLQNLIPTTVHFFGITGSIPVGLAMLFAALAGALLIALPGTARILQLRRTARNRHQ